MIIVKAFSRFRTSLLAFFWPFGLDKIVATFWAAPLVPIVIFFGKANGTADLFLFITISCF